MIGGEYFFIAAVAVSAAAAFTDWRTGEIPNWLTLGPLAVAPLAHVGVTFASVGVWKPALQAGLFSVLGAIACGIVPLLLYRLDVDDQQAMYGGDVKLLAAIGAICRPLVGIECEFYTFIAAALYAPGKLAYEGKLMAALGNMVAIVINPLLPKKRRKKISADMLTLMRLGPFVFVGTSLAVALNWRVP